MTKTINKFKEKYFDNINLKKTNIIFSKNYKKIKISFTLKNNKKIQISNKIQKILDKQIKILLIINKENLFSLFKVKKIILYLKENNKNEKTIKELKDYFFLLKEKFIKNFLDKIIKNQSNIILYLTFFIKNNFFLLKKYFINYKKNLTFLLNKTLTKEIIEKIKKIENEITKEKTMYFLKKITEKQTI